LNDGFIPYGADNHGILQKGTPGMTSATTIFSPAKRSRNVRLPLCYGMDIPGALNDGKGQSKGRKIMYSLSEVAS
jgi:hypothetical protein